VTEAEKEVLRALRAAAEQFIGSGVGKGHASQANMASHSTNVARAKGGTVYMVNKADVDDETIEQARTRQAEIAESEGLSVEVVGAAPDKLDDTDKVQRITTSDNAELKGAGLFENAEVGGQRSEVYVDKIQANIDQVDPASGEPYSAAPAALGNAIGNVGGHAIGHNLGKPDVERAGPIDLTRPETDVMVSPMTAITLVSTAPRFVASRDDE